MKTKLLVSLFIIISAGILFSTPIKNETKGYNLLFITLDTTRADCIGIYGNSQNLTPNLDSLGKDGIVFKNCYAPVPLTLPSHCSLFTGRYPLAHQVRNNGTYYLNRDELTLAEIVKGHGFQTAAIIASFTLFSKFGLNQGFDVYNESFPSQQMILNFMSEVTADRIYVKFMNWLQHYDGQKFFLWIHFYDPHYPYLPHLEIDTKFNNSNWMKYCGEIAFTDIFIGKIIQDLKSRNLLDSTLVVIVGDHGEAFGEHKEYGHGIFCYEECLKVPLIFYNMRLLGEGRLIDDRVSIVDIMPTILEIYNFDIPSPVQGKSLTHLIRGEKDESNRLIYFESMEGQEKNNWAPLTGVIVNDHKYISLPEPELYDLKKDQSENNNKFSKEITLAEKMDRELMQFVSDHSTLSKPSRRQLTPSDIQKLKALGYISSFSSKTNKMIDPKKGIILYAKIEDVKEQIKAGLFNQAERELKQLISENPDVKLPNIYQASYEIKMNTGRQSEALALLEEGLKTFPNNEEFKILLALCYFENEQMDKAEELCLQILEFDPLFSAAHILLGDVYESNNRIKEALLNFEQALEEEPQNELAKAKYVYLLVRDGQFRKARLILSELLKEPEYFQGSAQVEILVKIGVAFAENNEFESAVSLLTQVLEMSPSQPEAWLNLGTVYLKYGQLDKAFEYYKKALDIDPGLALGYSNLGGLYFARYMADNDDHLREEALKYFNKAIQLNPNLADAYNGRAAVYFTLGRPKDAVRDFKKSIEIKPDYFDAHINISLVFFQLGQKEEALKYLELFKKNYYHKLYPNEQQVLNRILSELEKN